MRAGSRWAHSGHTAQQELGPGKGTCQGARALTSDASAESSQPRCPDRPGSGGLSPNAHPWTRTHTHTHSTQTDHTHHRHTRHWQQAGRWTSSRAATCPPAWPPSQRLGSGSDVVSKSQQTASLAFECPLIRKKTEPPLEAEPKMPAPPFAVNQRAPPPPATPLASGPPRATIALRDRQAQRGSWCLCPQALSTCRF